jgi:hypothetical protein
MSDADPARNRLPVVAVPSQLTKWSRSYASASGASQPDIIPFPHEQLTNRNKQRRRISSSSAVALLAMSPPSRLVRRA